MAYTKQKFVNYQTPLDAANSYREFLKTTIRMIKL